MSLIPSGTKIRHAAGHSQKRKYLSMREAIRNGGDCDKLAHGVWKEQVLSPLQWRPCRNVGPVLAEVIFQESIVGHVPHFIPLSDAQPPEMSSYTSELWCAKDKGSQRCSTFSGCSNDALKGVCSFQSHGGLWIELDHFWAPFHCYKRLPPSASPHINGNFYCSCLAGEKGLSTCHLRRSAFKVVQTEWSRAF